MTRITNDQIATNSVLDQHLEQTQIQSVEIVDPVYEEPYIAYLTKKSTGWRGWILDMPEAECEAKTKSELLKTLGTKLRKALEEREAAWDKQLEEDIKAGKLDKLSEEALEDIKAGRLIDL